MSKSWHVLLSLVILCGLVGGGLLLSGNSQVEDGQFTPDETGYQVDPVFLDFYNLHGGRDVFGFPISGKLTLTGEDGIDRRVQFFQKGRLEVDPIDDQVRLSALPREYLLAKRTEPIAEGEVAAGAEYLAPTGHSIELAFKEFYYRHGGPEAFGYPITERIDEGDRLVQYFERMILQWNPERPGGGAAELVSIGEYLYRQAGLANPGQSMGSFDSDSPLAGAAVIHASLEVLAPITPLDGGAQEVYVYVTNQLGQPVQGARVTLDIDSKRINGQRPNAEFTDENGVAVFSFELSNGTAGEIVPVQAQVIQLDHAAEAAGSFRIWW